MFVFVGFKWNVGTLQVSTERLEMFLARIECLITKNFVKNCWSKVYTNENVRMFS